MAAAACSCGGDDAAPTPTLPVAEVASAVPTPQTQSRSRPRRDARVTGRVVDAEGRGIERFALRVLRVDDRGLLPVVLVREVSSFPGGAFELDAVPVGLCRIEAIAPGLAPTLSPAVATRSGETATGIELRLSPGGGLRGRVTDARTGAPVAGAMIRVSAEHERWMHGSQLASPARSGPDGAFALDRLSPGRRRVLVQHEDFASTRIDGVEVAESGESYVTVELAPGGLVTGVVRDAHGTLLAGAVVQLSSDGDNPEEGGYSASCDGAGRFRIEHVAPGRYLASACRPENADPFVTLREMRDSTFHLRVKEGATHELELSLAGRD